MSSTNPVAQVFYALACDLRLEVLDMIARGHASNRALAKALDSNNSVVGKAIRPLVSAGLVKRTTRKDWRPGQDVYTLAITLLARDLLDRVHAERELITALYRRDQRAGRAT